MLRNFKEILEKAKSFKKATLVVPIAEDEASLTAAIEAYKLGLINAILIGNKNRMTEAAKEFSGEGLANYEVIETDNPEEAAKKACVLCREKKADIILKGNLQTSQLLKGVLNADFGLRTNNLLSDVCVIEDPISNYKKLVGISDGGINILPNLDQKRQMIENAVSVMHKLGVAIPKVAVLSAIEKVNPGMPSSVDAAELKKMNLEGKIKGCIVDGPLALDNALHKWCAEMKGLKSEVAGDADILICPNIESGNIFVKGLVYYKNIKQGHVIVGAKVPVLINSRVDDAESKLHSILLAIVTGTER
jgi:phosphate butyryltransferase